jgi:hypothetical protein
MTGPATADGGDLDLDAGALDASCPTGWVSPRELVEAPRSNGTTCSCACGDASANPCTQGGDGGEHAVDFRLAGGNCGDETHTLALDGGCQAIGFVWAASTNKMQSPERVIERVRCPAIATKPPIGDFGTVALCAAGDVAGSCGGASDKACVVKPGALPICVVHDGDVACPLGFETRRVLVPRSGISDQRSCACSCGSLATTCANAELTFYADPACTAAPRTAPLDNSCAGITNAGTPQSYRYTADPDTWACAPTDASVPVDGGLTLPPPSTLCCPRL